jgi:hypothetical protein
MPAVLQPYMPSIWSGLVEQFKVPPASDTVAVDYYKRDEGSFQIQDSKGGAPAEIMGGTVGTVAVSGVLTFSDLTGITIVDYEGDNLPVKVGDTITFAAGNYWYLELSDGSKIYFNGTIYDSITGSAIANSGFTFTLLKTGQLASVLTALDYGYYQLVSGDQIREEQYFIKACVFIME